MRITIVIEDEGTSAAKEPSVTVTRQEGVPPKEMGVATAEAIDAGAAPAEFAASVQSFGMPMQPPSPQMTFGMAGEGTGAPGVSGWQDAGPCPFTSAGTSEPGKGPFSEGDKLSAGAAPECPSCGEKTE